MTSTSKNRPRKLRFINTYEAANTFYRDLVPALVDVVDDIEVAISRSAYRDDRGELEQSLVGSGISVRKIGTNMFQRLPRSVRRIADSVTFAAVTMVETLFARREEITVFLTQPPMFYVWGLVLRAIRGRSYVCVTMDLYPDVLCAHGLYRRDGIVNKCLLFLSNAALERADTVVVIGRCMKKRLEDRGIKRERIVYIPNWSNELVIKPILPERNRMRDQLGLRRSDFVVLYAGNMGIAHHFGALLVAAERLQGLDGIHFVLAGGGIRKCAVESVVRERNLKNVTLLDFQPDECLAELQALGDIHYTSLRTEFAGTLVPSKAYSALAAGRPLIYHGPPECELAFMILEHGVGTVIEANDGKDLAELIVTYSADDVRRLNEGREARKLAENQFSRNRGITAYRNVLVGAVNR